MPAWPAPVANPGPVTGAGDRGGCRMTGGSSAAWQPPPHWVGLFLLARKRRVCPLLPKCQPDLRLDAPALPSDPRVIDCRTELTA